ncbi:MAG: hypothetical protein II000_10830 [Clostridia bacterium]|nr:hypothetical protein [Clostridia bacterium]
MENWITVDSFGADVPENWEEIADFLNDIIRERGIEDDHNAVNDLWEEYWHEELPDAPSPKRIWYAVVLDQEDTDWGTGSFDKDEAIRMCLSYREDEEYKDAYIAMIDDGPDPVCIDVIKDF